MSIASLSGPIINQIFIKWYKIDLHLSVSKIDKIEERINKMEELQIKHHKHINHTDNLIEELQKECYKNIKTIKKLTEKNYKLENSNLQLMQFYTTLQQQCDRYSIMHGEILYELEKLIKKIDNLETKYQELEKYRIDYIFAIKKLENKTFGNSNF